jgi:hypothetical protein
MADAAAATDVWSKAVAFIREFGLPSFLVIWFLFRIEKKLEKFTKTLHNLLTVNVLMLKTLDKDEEAEKLLTDGESTDPYKDEHLKKKTTKKKLKSVEEEK